MINRGCLFTRRDWDIWEKLSIPKTEKELRRIRARYKKRKQYKIDKRTKAYKHMVQFG